MINKWKRLEYINSKNFYILGELLIAETENVALYTSLSEPRNQKKGVLTVTNFKLSFIPTNDDDEYPEVQQSFFLKPYEICLSSIDTVYHVNEKSRKKLNLGHSISHKIKELQILCKVCVYEYLIR